MQSVTAEEDWSLYSDVVANKQVWLNPSVQLSSQKQTQVSHPG